MLDFTAILGKLLSSFKTNSFSCSNFICFSYMNESMRAHFGNVFWMSWMNAQGLCIIMHNSISFPLFFFPLYHSQICIFLWQHISTLHIPRNKRSEIKDPNDKCSSLCIFCLLLSCLFSPLRRILPIWAPHYSISVAVQNSSRSINVRAGIDI